METQNGAWYSLAASVQAYRSAFALITFPGKGGKAPQPPCLCLFPAASSDQEECNPCPLLPSPSLWLHLPPRAVSRCGSRGWSCAGAALGRAIPSSLCVTRACLQNKELLHRHVSNSVCVMRNEKILAHKPQSPETSPCTKQIKRGENPNKTNPGQM